MTYARVQMIWWTNWSSSLGAITSDCFTVYEERYETNEDCVRKVFQLLNRFYSQKVWTRDDVERANAQAPRAVT